MSFKDNCLANKSILTNKFVRINGRPGQVRGMGNKALKMGFPMPTGFSQKKEVVQGFINWEDVTVDLRREILRHVPQSQGQQTLL